MLQPFLDNPALKIYAVVAALIGIHMLLLALWTGTVRVQRKQWVNPEDAKLNKGDNTESDHPDVQRVKRAHQNAMENALPFFAIGLLYALSNPSHNGAAAYFYTFLVVRVLHSIFYLWGRQPFRTLMFATGVLVMLGMGQHVIRAAM
jgi:microsomal prostaglandin-E synthase 1